MLRRRGILPLILALFVVSLVVVNAAVFAYRWMLVNIEVKSPDQASGAACTGFYSKSDQAGIPLPNAGTNYGAITFGSNHITVTPGNVVCQFDSYKLFESISVSMTITNGSWYIKDLYGFGYYGTTGAPSRVYVWVKVEQAVSGVNYAELILYNASNDPREIIELMRVDLTTTGTVGPITLNLSQALQLDLNISVSNTGTYNFKVGFYVSQQSAEKPR